MKSVRSYWIVLYLWPQINRVGLVLQAVLLLVAFAVAAQVSAAPQFFNRPFGKGSAVYISVTQHWFDWNFQDRRPATPTSARPTLVSAALRPPPSAVPTPPTAARPAASPIRWHRADSDRRPRWTRAAFPTRNPDSADSAVDSVPADLLAIPVSVAVHFLDVAKIFLFSLSSYRLQTPIRRISMKWVVIHVIRNKSCNKMLWVSCSRGVLLKWGPDRFMKSIVWSC